MNKVRDISWTEVFQHWRDSESKNPDWIRAAIEVKGWPDWESWRMFTADQLGLPGRRWQLYEVTDPVNEIPTMLVGPFTGWQSRLPEPNIHTFADLIRIPEQYAFFATHPGIRRINLHFPDHTILTGLRRPDGKIVLVEGHHRATALAIAQLEQMPVHFSSPVHIALADTSVDEAGLFDRVLARGTKKVPPAGFDS